MVALIVFAVVIGSAVIVEVTWLLCLIDVVVAWTLKLVRLLSSSCSGVEK